MRKELLKSKIKVAIDIRIEHLSPAETAEAKFAREGLQNRVDTAANVLGYVVADFLNRLHEEKGVIAKVVEYLEATARALARKI